VGVPLPQMEHLYGKTHLEEEMLDLIFQLSPSSYFQVNTKGAEVLYYAIIDLVEPTEDTTVLDLCCGTGGIGLCIAKVSNRAHTSKYIRHVVHDKQQ
jgi:tRNA (uracil-5-)-methyltransferase